MGSPHVRTEQEAQFKKIHREEEEEEEALLATRDTF